MGKKQHGGRREGAGRPPKPPAERAPARPVLTLRIEQDLYDAYKAASEHQQGQAREAMIAALRAALEELRER